MGMVENNYIAYIDIMYNFLYRQIKIHLRVKI